ncbi:MAG: dihydroorotate dehydrogenase [Bacteroides sp.]|nr:dihydroorotate dehydrogenase [Prevotella sp.]MCM1407538.1 dihydroorotate dehydrogenase [Treponema brennaborense]MCM1469312.1 dihydroorotate dehydrogenase [Bacteroides sp.]
MNKTDAHAYPVFAVGKTISCTRAAEEVFLLKITVDSLPAVECGQFFMLRSVPSKVLLSRPISVYMADGNVLEFLILRKGSGTAELCALAPGSSVDILGPQGNTFPRPSVRGSSGTVFPAIIGGGIGVAPVAGFAASLPPASYDFYACFRHESYGLEHIAPHSLCITTDDGHEGIRGMLPDVFTPAVLAEKGYTEVYACGPVPMLAYVQKVCAAAKVPCYLSMEAHMACGMGACLGCTVKTVHGNRRCCKDGPVFAGNELLFDSFPSSAPAAKQNIPISAAAADLSVSVAGVRFANPVIAASGTFGYGSEYSPLFDVNMLGGICSKGLTLEPKAGNSGTRLQETPSGLINSIGLENPGIPEFIEKKLPLMLSLKPVTIVNLSGSSVETYVQGARLLDKTDAPMIELNISCPNVKSGGMAFGLEPAAAAEVTAAVRAATSKPLMVKLSPNAPDIVSVADAVRRAGADAISLVNTFQAMAVDIEKKRPVFDNIKAGLAGPAIKPLALRLVYDVCLAMKHLPEEERIPVIGLGGIQTWQDAAEFIMAGACAVQVGTATFAHPNCMISIIEGFRSFMMRNKYEKISDFCGIILP